MTPSDQQPAIDTLLADLDREKLPREAIQAAREHREAIIPRLIETLTRAVEAAERGTILEGHAGWLSLMLLTEFQVREALPVYRRLLALDDETQGEMLGDLIPENGAQILLSLCGDDPEVVSQILHDDGISEGNRGSMAEGLAWLARDGVIPRNDAIRRLRVALEHAVQDRKAELAAFLITELIRLKAVEALPEIEEAYRQRSVETFIVGSLADVKRDITDPASLGSRHDLPRHIDDIITEIESWSTRQDVESGRHKPAYDADKIHQIEAVADRMTAEVTQIVRRIQQRGHVGRNDPCPCGSGKKFKKCCYGRSEGDSARDEAY